MSCGQYGVQRSVQVGRPVTPLVAEPYDLACGVHAGISAPRTNDARLGAAELKHGGLQNALDGAHLAPASPGL